MHQPREPAPTNGVTFHQLDVTLDGVRHPFSEWGQAEVIYYPTNAPIYFNLALGNNWIVQNILLLSPNGTNAITWTYWLDGSPSQPPQQRTEVIVPGFISMALPPVPPDSHVGAGRG